MQGAERDLIKMCMEALKRAHDNINSLTCSYAVSGVRSGKHDTYGLDESPEEVIKDCIARYDPRIVLVTEETGRQYRGEKDLEPTQIVLVSDPTDRSIKLKEFLDRRVAENDTNASHFVGDVVKSSIEKWTEELGNPTISGASGSITAIKDRRILFNVMVNYVTGEMFVSSPLGNKYGRFDENFDAYRKVDFPPDKRSERYATFLGKTGYRENLEKCELGLDPKDCIDPWVGGPMRILQLSNLNHDDNIGFIMSNGEKFGEWIGWLSWVKYSERPNDPDERSLSAHRIFFESPMTKELVTVAPAPHYSIFRDENGETRINLEMMFQLEDPSHYRETLIVLPRDNMKHIARVRGLGKHQKELILSK